MGLERLITIPLGQLMAMAQEGWDAMQGNSRYRDVPPVSPDASVVGEAVLDQTFSLGTQVLVGVPLPEEVRRSQREAEEACQLYERQGWLADPASYHSDPPPLLEVEETGARSFVGPRMMDYRHIRFPSSFRPHPEEPAGERYQEQERNRYGHALVMEHEGPPRPWLVCVHGFSMGGPLANFHAFRAHMLHERLGMNLIFPCLPLHGPRASGRVSGGELLVPDYLQMVHLFAQAVSDVRRLIGWVRERGAPGVGVYGISLGGYVSSLVAGLEDDLDCLIAGIPAVDFPNLARDNEPWIMRRYDEALGIHWDTVRVLTHVVSPLAFAPKLPRERRFIYAGTADRVVRPDQPRALWRHWDRPEIHWFSGGHVLGSFKSSVADFISDATRRTGLARS